jgi:hypothetical protein
VNLLCIAYCLSRPARLKTCQVFAAIYLLPYRNIMTRGVVVGTLHDQQSFLDITPNSNGITLTDNTM